MASRQRPATRRCPGQQAASAHRTSRCGCGTTTASGAQPAPAASEPQVAQGLSLACLEQLPVDVVEVSWAGLSPLEVCY